jgi:integrase
MRGYLDKLRTFPRFWNSGDKPDLAAVDPVDRLSTATVVKTFRNIITFFNWALKQEMIDKNPAAVVDLPTNKRNYTQPPPRELADALCNVPPPRNSALGVLEWEILPWFYRYTGGRLGEIARLTAEDVVVEHGIRCLRVHTEKTTMRVHRQQGDDLRFVPIHPKLAPFVDRALARSPSGLLFPLAGHSPSESKGMQYGYNFSRLYARHAKKIWDKMHVHCWRSYVVTETARAGIPEEVRMRLVGHVTRTVHQGYNAVDISRLKEAVEAIP